MTLKHGKFYNDNGEIVPLEFGNKEQIDLLKRAADLKEGVWNPFGKVRCLCGNILNYTQNDAGTDFKCQQCEAEYHVMEDEDDGLVTLKMK